MALSVHSFALCAQLLTDNSYGHEDRNLLRDAVHALFAKTPLIPDLQWWPRSWPFVVCSAVSGVMSLAEGLALRRAAVYTRRAFTMPTMKKQ
jgi:hypothetical protein